MPTVSSPCIGICTLDEAHRLCLGCGRTLDEIAAWATLAESVRRRIMAGLPGRLAAPDASRPGGRDPALDVSPAAP